MEYESGVAFSHLLNEVCGESYCHKLFHFLYILSLCFVSAFVVLSYRFFVVSFIVRLVALVSYLVQVTWQVPTRVV